MKNEKIKGTAYLCFDVSGSIDSEKREYYRQTYRHYKNKYEYVKVIKHTTVAKFTDIEDVLAGTDSGGTYISSALKLAIGEIIVENKKSNTVVICGDGDNWSEDDERVVTAIKTLTTYCKVDYFEFLPSTYTTTMFGRLNKYLKDSNNLKLYKITDKKQNIFGKNINRKESFNISIEIDGDKTIAKMGNKWGKATCNPEDEYSKEEGIRVAVCRLLELEPFED